MEYDPDYGKIFVADMLDDSQIVPRRSMMSLVGLIIVTVPVVLAEVFVCTDP